MILSKRTKGREESVLLWDVLECPVRAGAVVRRGERATRLLVLVLIELKAMGKREKVICKETKVLH